MLYTEAISDGSASNGRGGLVQDATDTNWGALKILGYVQSSRTPDVNHPTDHVRSYGEATADAYLCFQIIGDAQHPVGSTVRVEFDMDTDLGYAVNRAPSLLNPNDRYVNWATFGGLIQTSRPGTTMNFNLSTAPMNNPNPLFAKDENGNYVNLEFDDPARPEQYDAIDPEAIVDLDRSLPPVSGRGGPIPEVGDTLFTDRTSLQPLYRTITLADLQEYMLQDPNSLNPANNSDATNPQYSVGNTTFNNGTGDHVWYFDAVVGSEYTMYLQLAANITDDGGINGQFGSAADPEDFASLYYRLSIANVPEPGTIVMMGLALASGIALVRRKMKQ